MPYLHVHDIIVRGGGETAPDEGVGRPARAHQWSARERLFLPHGVGANHRAAARLRGGCRTGELATSSSGGVSAGARDFPERTKVSAPYLGLQLRLPSPGCGSRPQRPAARILQETAIALRVCRRSLLMAHRGSSQERKARAIGADSRLMSKWSSRGCSTIGTCWQSVSEYR